MNEYGKKMILAFSRQQKFVTFQMDKTFWQLSNGFIGNYMAHSVVVATVIQFHFNSTKVKTFNIKKMLWVFVFQIDKIENGQQTVKPHENLLQTENGMEWITFYFVNIQANAIENRKKKFKASVVK